MPNYATRINAIRRLVLPLSTTLALLGCGGPEQEPAAAKTAAEVPALRDFGGLGGDFVLTDHTGAPFALEQVRGRAALLFFGFTFCPDICPMTLSKLAQVYERLAVGPERLLTLFVSVDPQRDTPEVLAQYIGHFGIGAVGLTGEPATIDSVVAAYGAQYAVTDDESGEYLINHSTYTYLIDAEGRVRFLFRRADGPDKIAAVIRQLFDEPTDAQALAPAAFELLARAPLATGCGAPGSVAGLDARGGWFVIGDDRGAGGSPHPASLQPAFHLGLDAAPAADARR